MFYRLFYYVYSMLYVLMHSQFDGSPTRVDYTPLVSIENVMFIRISFEIDDAATREIEVFRLYVIVCVEESK